MSAARFPVLPGAAQSDQAYGTERLAGAEPVRLSRVRRLGVGRLLRVGSDPTHATTGTLVPRAPQADFSIQSVIDPHHFLH